MKKNYCKIHELSAMFPPNTAGEAMIVDIPIFSQKIKVKTAKSQLLKLANKYKSLNYLYIVDRELKLVGVLSIKELMQARTDQTLSSLMSSQVVTVGPLSTVPQVALVALQHNLKMVPIVDQKNRLLGAFSSNQLMGILKKEFADDLLRLSGVRILNKHHGFNSLRLVKTRMPWMLIGLLGGLVTAMIVYFFSSSIQTMVVLAVFMPVIMSAGATSANQSALIFLRNMLHGDINNARRYLFNELKVDGILAIILGLILFVIITIFLNNIVLAGAVAIALVLTVLAGSAVGVLAPMLLHKYHQDPALGAGPFLTIIKDILAMAIYFSVATGVLALFS